MNANRKVGLFLDGARDIISAALVVGLAGGIIVILEDGRVIDTILYRLLRIVAPGEPDTSRRDHVRDPDRRLT